MEQSNNKIEGESKKAKHLICDQCKVELPNEASMRQHLLGQKHKKLIDAEEDRKRVERKCGLFIRGFSPNVDKDTILSYFSKFGKVVWVHFDHSFLLLDYDDPTPASNVINRTHYLGGQRLMVKYRQLRRQVTAQKKEESNDFVERLKDVPNFEDQLEMLGQNLQPASQQQFPKYNKVCKDLYNALCHTFPYCRIHPFGSTITGLEFNNSDVDVFISGVKWGNNDVPYLYRAKSLLLNSHLFANVIVIPQAKIPILKCVHVETGINCDINLKNMLGVCNSRLINYYMNLDPKLRKIMIALKFWAKTHKITGQNHLFTNYSLNLMLIFFLQHNPFRFPSILKLQENPQFFNNQDGWNGGFQPIMFTCSELHCTSVSKLLEMFFSFYVEYEYGINVICPYLGVFVKKQTFKEPNSLPNTFNTYKQYVAATNLPLKVETAICVQDPFEHSRNTTPIVSTATLETFVSFCRLGKKFCQENEGPILYKLLTEVPENVTALTVVKSQSSQFSIPMRPGMKYIEEKHKSGPERHKAWFESMVKFTKIVLKDFLRLEMTEITNTASKTKHKKADGQSDVYAETTPVCFKCRGKLNLWQARKSTAKNKPEGEEPKKGVIEKEIAITEQLCVLYKDVYPDDDIINFEINLEHFTDPPKVTIDVKKVAAYKNSFKSFVTFFSVKLPAWFKVFEQEQNECL
ncbi:speckle targeted PIP5K1A-regulated poly(A) polymerase isoform X2 [Anoplophora glabripennis]|nr:speckle targeted PIP5K1A-regulated poly(A) polymerase isoform X2 [Anoplophora glabripennis]